MLFSPVCVCRAAAACLFNLLDAPPTATATAAPLLYLFYYMALYCCLYYTFVCICACLQCNVIKRYAPSSSLSPFYTMYFMKRKYP